MVDGLKPGQRKILFCSFKRNFTKQAKVAQFSGYVSEHSAYHHGEQSLASTIVGMAQDFVGSNNINLLLPRGQFGTRNQARQSEVFTYCKLTLNTCSMYINFLTYRVAKTMQVLDTFILSLLQSLGTCFPRMMTFSLITCMKMDKR